MIIATIITKFSNGEIKYYHKSFHSKIDAILSAKKMKDKAKKYPSLSSLSVLWDGKNRPWRDKYASFLKAKHFPP
jgi:predicted N-formylglutamate amidohydrolase